MASLRRLAPAVTDPALPRQVTLRCAVSACMFDPTQMV